MTSIADTLEKAKKLQEANPPPILAEVITKTVQGTNGNKKELTPETTNVTPDKPIAQATSKKMTNGFMTPNKKHIASSATSATLTMEGIEMSNAYKPLNLQSLGSTRGHTLSPKKELSPSKQMQKQPKKNAAFMAALDEQFTQVDELGLNEK